MKGSTMDASFDGIIDYDSVKREALATHLRTSFDRVKGYAGSDTRYSARGAEWLIVDDQDSTEVAEGERITHGIDRIDLSADTDGGMVNLSGYMLPTDSVAGLYDALHSTGEASAMTYAHVAKHYPESLPENAVRFPSIGHIRDAVIASGSHYFDRDAVRHFRGRTDNELFGGRFWVESRKYVNLFHDESAPREYMVAWVVDNGRGGILSIEKLGNFPNLNTARTWARRMAEVTA